MIDRLRRAPDTWAVLILILLWLLFFWRLYTPSEVDAVSLEQGDFSGQFVSWTAYSVERFSDGEIPLWNPYMNAGSPFLADPQTAVFYPPRLLTVGLLALQSEVTNGEVYQALQIEMTLHVLVGTLLMYAFLRQTTIQHESRISIISSMVGALIFGFGGFLSAYPQLQIPLLETAIWIPLVLLGIYKATGTKQVRWSWLMVGGLGIGLSILAGHPQTYVWTGYISAAYFIYRAWQVRFSWKTTILALIILMLIGGGLAAIQALPALDFQRQTYREGLSFDDKGGGFAFQDIAQILFPGLLGRWSPLYVGILGVVMAGVAIWRRVNHYWFWLTVGGVAFLLSFGQKLALYHLVYIIMPGFGFFRGQERAAYIITTAAAILAAFGTAHLLQWDILTDHKAARLLRRVLIGLMVFCAIFAVIFFIMRLIPPNGELYQTALQSTIFATLMTAVTFLIITQVMRPSASHWWQFVLVAILVFDLFSINMNNENYEPIPASQRLPEPDYIGLIRENLDPGQHVEGLRGIQSSYGSLYRVPDIWGDSPLRLDGIEYLLWNIPIERRWELLSVSIVNSEWEALPVPHTLLGSGADNQGAFNIFQLDDPRPFAHLVYEANVIADEAERHLLLNDTTFPLRNVVILEDNPGPLEVGEGQVELFRFEAEHIEIAVETDKPAILSLALPYVNGWQATIDGEKVDILRAYTGLSALYIKSGAHQVALKYHPWTFDMGAFISIATLLVLLVVSVILRKENAVNVESSDHLED